jgi:dTDP-4-amino-4,6-dideoxygalactose transaminase
MNVPLVDLAYQHRAVEHEVSRKWAGVIERNAYVEGEEVEEFEREFASFSRVRHCIGVGNGTDAVELSLRAAGLHEGDEVVVPANSFVATAAAVVRAGATPTFCDVDPHTYLLDPDDVHGRLGPKVRAVIAVHLYGQVAPVEEVIAAGGDDVFLIEDAAQSHGATRHGAPVGGFGVAAGTSFYPAKNLGAYGDAGAVLTSSDDVAEAVRRLRNHGALAKYDHESLGFNSRLDTMQAVVLLAKLRYLTAWNEARRKAAERYHELLETLEEVQRPAIAPGNEHVWHLYVVRVPNRDEVLTRLLEAGVGAGIHYPVPLHLLPSFRSLGYAQGEFPVAERAAQEILSLPIFPGVTADQQEQVVNELRKAVR